MADRDELSKAITANPVAARAADDAIVETAMHPIHSAISRTEDSLPTSTDFESLVLIGLLYLLTNIALLFTCLGSGSFRLDGLVLLVLPVATALVVFLLKMSAGFRYSWIAFGVFLTWLWLIGILNLYVMMWAYGFRV
jgi:hypothetical protein